MRLIDAGKLIQAILDFPDCENGYSDTYDKEYIIGEIDLQPTVEAIPVEWLCKFRDDLDYLSEIKLIQACDCIIDAWRAENGQTDKRRSA